MLFFQGVAGEPPKEKEKPSKGISLGMFFGMAKLPKPKTTVEALAPAPRVKPLAKLVEAPRKQIVTPFQATPKRQDQPRPLLQPKFGVSVTSKPHFNKC